MMSDSHHKIDVFEAALARCTPVECALNHSWIEGEGYLREIFIPQGTWVTSMIHKYEHPFAMWGKARVYSENDGIQILEGTVENPYKGVTKPGTRRIIYNETDVIWITFHPTKIFPKDNSESSILEAIELIYDEIIEKRENPLLGGIVRNNVLTKNIDDVQEQLPIGR